MSEAQRKPQAFCLGKLPHHADFVSRGVEAAEAELWFEALAGGLAIARGHSSGGFESAHDAAPPWRFVSASCGLGDDWRAGAIAPSVDRSGRRFFFVAGVRGLDREQALAHGAFLANSLEEAVYRVLSENLTVEAALEIAEQAFHGADHNPDPPLEALPGCSADGVWWTVGGEKYPPRVVSSGQLTAELVAGFIILPVMVAAQ